MTKSYFQAVIDDLRHRKHPAESMDIAASVGCSTRTALKHLRVLRGQGKVVRQPKWFGKFKYTWTYKWIQKKPQCR